MKMTDDIPFIIVSFHITKTGPITAKNVDIVASFLPILNNFLAAQTSLNYHALPPSNHKIAIPVFKYTREDYEKPINKLIRDRCKILEKAVAEAEFSERGERHILRNIETYIRYYVNPPKFVKHSGLDNMFEITAPDIEYNAVLKFKKFQLEYPSIKRYKLIDNSYISLFIDPYFLSEDAVVVADLSKKFAEYNYQYNALHLYEHLMTHCWDDCKQDESYIMNGYTVMTGACNIYNTVYNMSLIPKFLNALIDMILKARHIDFWKTPKIKEIIKKETIRTISETRVTRDFSASSRSDPGAYDFKYNTDIFCKWSQEPFNILIIGSKSDIKIDIDKINAKILSSPRTEITIKIPTFDYIPMECFCNKARLFVEKKDVNTIYDTLIKAIWIKTELFGIDCGAVFPPDITVDFNYYLHVLLYLFRFVKKVRDDEICKQILFPTQPINMC